jgi:hypothetical protein
MDSRIWKPNKERKVLGAQGHWLRLLGLCGILLATGCAPQVLTQRVPVSSQPMGARVYVDGKPVGTTPTAVDLERTQSHILTLVKENYRQADVVIRQRKKTEDQLFKAINSGVTTGMMMKDPTLGMMRGMDAYSTQEKTGEAYELQPAAVTVDLEPLDAERHAPDDRGESLPHPSPEPSQGAQRPPADAQTNRDALISGAVKGAAVAGAAAVGTREKRWETSSSTKTDVRPDGSVVTKHKSTSVGVSVNPIGILNLMNTLYQ